MVIKMYDMNDLFRNWESIKKQILNSNPKEISMEVGDIIYRGGRHDSEQDAIDDLKRRPKHWTNNFNYAKNYTTHVSQGSKKIIIVAKIISENNLFLNYDTYDLFHVNRDSFKQDNISPVEAQCLFGVDVANSLFDKEYSGVYEVSKSGNNEILIKDMSIFEIVDTINIE